MFLCFYASNFYASMHQLQISPLTFLFELELQATITIYKSTSTSNSDFKPQLRLSLSRLSPGLYLNLFRRALDRISILIFLFDNEHFLIENVVPV